MAHNRRLTVAALSSLAALTLILGGCAHQGGSIDASNQRATSQQPQADSLARAVTRTDGSANEQATVEWPGAANLSAPDYQWPSPSEDLWSKVQSGLALPANRSRLRVRRWTQYYATHANDIQASLKQARPWLYHIVRQVEKRNMPTEIALLPIVESGFNTRAVSYVGATGLWQFMPGTADHMNLERNWWYDGRNDPFASTRAALTYLQQLHSHYDGNWLLALAAYNAGPGTIDDALRSAKRADKPVDFWQLDNIPDETRNYVPKLLAVRWIMKAPAKFGVSWPRLKNQPKTRQVELPGQTDLSVAARMADIPASRLKQLNPDIQHKRTRPRNGRLIVPTAKADAFRAKLASAAPSQLVKRQGDRYRVQQGDALSSIANRFDINVAALRHANGLSDNSIRAGQTLRIPRSGEQRTQSTQSRQYTVQPGDSLWQIAHSNDTSVAAIQRANGDLDDTLHPGETVTLPISGQSATPAQVVVHSGDSLWAIAQKNHVSVANLRRWNRLDPDSKLQPGQTLAVGGQANVPDYYEVQSGDSLWSIADRFSMRVGTLKRLNSLSDGHSIQPGQRLRLQPSVSS